MTGLGIKKPKNAMAPPAETASLDSTQLPEWLTGEAPNPPRRKKPRVDSGGQLVKGSMRAA
jgi:hypothetical protein